MSLKKSFSNYIIDAFLILLLYACSNSKGVDYDQREEIDNLEGTQNCFNNFRLPNLQSPTCRRTIFSEDSITNFPPSGFFQKTFTIIFPSNKPLNCEIGGKIPTAESPRMLAIQIDSSTTIRCTDLSDTAATKAEIIRTYILEKAPDIATVFITSDPNSLFDPDTGIYMEGPNAEDNNPHYGANYWLDKEIPIFIEFIEPNVSVPCFAKYAGLKIFGNYSRVHPKKSVAITFREKYGDKRLYYSLFREFPDLKVFKSFILRNNGNNFGNDYIRDRLASSISEGLGVDYQRGRFVVVYYNGKYFGIHDLRERSNEYYFETHYEISHDKINLLKADNSVSAGSATDHIALIDWLKNHNLSNDSNYAYISSKIDIDNYINYMQIEMFANNRDWPGNNQKKWNSPGIQNQWRWFLYDIDLSFGNNGKTAQNNIFEYTLSEDETIWQNNPKFTFLFRSLMQNKKFKESFINRMASLMQMNFNATRVSVLIEKMMKEIESEIPYDQKRWSLSISKMNKNLEIIKNFAKDRPAIIIQDLQDYFNLRDTSSIIFSIKGSGNILIHNLPLDKVPLSITFFNGFPVTITAVPQNGSIWSSWSDGEKNATRTILPEQFNNLTAIFR